MRASVKFDIHVNDDISESDFKEWIEFETGMRGDIRVDNKLEPTGLREILCSHNISIRFYKNAKKESHETLSN